MQTPEGYAEKMKDLILTLYHDHTRKGNMTEPTQMFIGLEAWATLKRETLDTLYFESETSRNVPEYMGMKVYTVSNDLHILELK